MIWHELTNVAYETWIFFPCELDTASEKCGMTRGIHTPNISLSVSASTLILTYVARHVNYFMGHVCLQTQMHSLTPFGADLFSDNMLEDNMTWNFVAGLTVACEILESYGCVVHVISPRSTDAALGAGGTRVKILLPSLDAASDLNSS